LHVLKAKLRGVVIDQDILGLGSVNVTSLMIHDDDKIHAFGHCIKMLTSQVLEGFLNNTARDELEFVTGSLPLWIAGDCVAKHMLPRDAWSVIAAAFDSVTRKDKVSAFALHVVMPQAEASA
jgi:hypothetical protein